MRERMRDEVVADVRDVTDDRRDVREMMIRKQSKRWRREEMKQTMR